jgi:hypothetical protein
MRGPLLPIIYVVFYVVKHVAQKKKSNWWFALGYLHIQPAGSSWKAALFCRFGAIERPNVTLRAT